MASHHSGTFADFAANRRLLQSLLCGVPCLVSDALGQYSLTLRLDAPRQHIMLAPREAGGDGSAADSDDLVVIALSDVSLVGLDEGGAGGPAARLETVAGDSFAIIPSDGVLAVPLAHCLSALVRRSPSGATASGNSGGARFQQQQQQNVSNIAHTSPIRPRVASQHSHTATRSSPIAATAPSSLLLGGGAPMGLGAQQPSANSASAQMAALSAQIADLKGQLSRQEAAMGLVVSSLRAIERQLAVSAALGPAIGGAHQQMGGGPSAASSRVSSAGGGIPLLPRTGSGRASAAMGISGTPLPTRPSTRPHRGHVDPLLAPEEGEDGAVPVVGGAGGSARVRFAARPATAGGILRPTHTLVVADDDELLGRARGHHHQGSGSDVPTMSDATDDDEGAGSRRENNGPPLPESAFMPRLTSIPSPPHGASAQDMPFDQGVADDERGGGREIAVPDVSQHGASAALVAAPSTVQLLCPTGICEMDGSTVSGRSIGRRAAVNHLKPSAAADDHHQQHDTSGRGGLGLGLGGPAVGLGDLGDDMADYIRQQALLSSSAARGGRANGPHRSSKEESSGGSSASSIRGGGSADGDAMRGATSPQHAELLQAYRDINGSDDSSSDDDDDDTSSSSDGDDTSGGSSYARDVVAAAGPDGEAGIESSAPPTAAVGGAPSATPHRVGAYESTTTSDDSSDDGKSSSDDSGSVQFRAE